MARTQYQFSARIVRNGGRINGDSYRGTAGDSWSAGDILTKTSAGRVASLSSPIDDDAEGPVAFVALSDFAGDATQYVPVQEIKEDTVFEAQILTGSADADDQFKRGTLVQDGTTGNYAVSLASAANASIEVVDVEPEFAPFSADATGNYNLVWFKFLPDVLEIAPETVS